MNEVIGLIPAAGLAKRLAPLPCSKELFPVGFKVCERDGRAEPRPKPVSEYLIERMRDAGAHRIYIVLSHAKWDLIRYYGSGLQMGVHLAYLYLDHSLGMPCTLNELYPWLAGKDETILFGMPDTIFWPYDAFAEVLSMYRQVEADLVLGVFPTDQPERFSVVELDERSRVLSVTDKPAHTHLYNTWGMACWGPAFTELLNTYVRNLPSSPGEVILANVFQLAIDKGLVVHGKFFEEGKYIDIGLAEDLFDTVCKLASVDRIRS
jgi:glucose-1-phosphate thymidylyltransferase